MTKSFLKSGLIRILFVMTLLCAAGPVQTLFAQSAAMMQMASGELQKRGLNEAEVRTRLLAEGIDVDNISPTDYPQYQDRVMKVLDQMQAEKKTAQAAAGEGQPVAEATVVMSATDMPTTTAAEAEAEAQQRVIQADAAEKGEGANIYGHTLFTDHTLDVFRTTDGAQAPDTYILGESDEIHISIFGTSQIEMQQRIASDGSIKPAGAARIFLKGLTLAQARKSIQSNLAASYMFNEDQFAVTVVAARTVMVNIFGEVSITGGFSLSALNSAFNALSAAGGPTAIGSVRNIQLIRGKQTSKLDLYAFMKNPSYNTQFDLQNNDVIFVPVREKLVAVTGAVKRPMSYEMLKNEDLKDLIAFAGGLTQDAYPDFVQLQRYENGEVKLFEYDLSAVLSGKTKVVLNDGDSITIKSITKPMEAYVNVIGSVYYPGNFDLKNNTSLAALLQNAKPTYEAKTDLVFVSRTRNDNTVSLLAVPYPGYEGAPDFTLQARDSVRVMNQADYRDVATIEVNGHVRMPYTRTFGLNERLTLAQAIDYAGGLKESVYPVAYIFRRNILNPKEVQYIRVLLEEDKDMLLQPGDQLNVYDNATYTNDGEVRVYGAVKNPVSVTYDPSLSLNALLTMAGGFEAGAAYNRVEVFRLVLSPTDKPKLDLITVTVDTAYQLVTPSDFKLQPYDKIVVRRVPEFRMNDQTVELNGRVRYPGTYLLENRQIHLSEIIAMAGGLMDDADPNGTRLFRTYKNRGDISVSVKEALSHKKSLKDDPILMDGDVIDINLLENIVIIRETGTRMAQYVGETTTADRKNLIYQGNKSAKWYVRHYAGGFQKNVERRSVTVTLPNGQMEGTTSFLGIKSYPKVVPGSVIAMRMDVEKVKKEAEVKEEVDWNRVLATMLTTLTSTISILAILKNM